MFLRIFRMPHEVLRSRVLCVIFSRFPTCVKIYSLYSSPYSLQLLVNPLQKNPTYTDTCHTMLTALPIPDSFIFQQTLCSNADGVKFCSSISLCSCYTCPRQTRTSDGGFFSLLFPIAYVQAVSQRVTTNLLCLFSSSSENSIFLTLFVRQI